MPLDRVPLWRGDHVAIKHLVEDFARYLYLPRLVETKVLLNAITDGLNLLTWEQETFAYADSYDEASGRYRGLRFGQPVTIGEPTCALLLWGRIRYSTNVCRYESLKRSELPYLPVSREESQRLSAADFPEEDFGNFDPGSHVSPLQCRSPFEIALVSCN